MAHDHDHQACGCGCGGHAGPGPAGRDWATAPARQVVCPCLGLDKAAILGAIQAGAFTLPLLKVMTGAGRGRDCARLNPTGGTCEADLAELLRLYAQPPEGWPTGGCGHH
jgi:NAD(P)H-nitrite reductase large subunit